jgi:hypothetical protein
MGCGCGGKCNSGPQFLSGPAVPLPWHPHTVRVPKMPLYQLGWLGDNGDDDDVPVSSSELPDSIPLETFTPMTTSYGAPGSPTDTLESTPYNTPTFVANPDASGVLVAGSSSATGSVASSLTSALANLFSPTPSPRVATAPAAGTTVASSLGSSMLPLLAIGAVGVLLLAGGSGPRRRR